MLLDVVTGQTNVMPSWVLLILFAGINLLMAYYDALRIKSDLPINHTVNASVYGALILFFYPWLLLSQILGLLFLRPPVFNTALNLFRGLPATYISSSTTSKIDQILNPIIRKVGYWPFNTALLLIAMWLLF